MSTFLRRLAFFMAIHAAVWAVVFWSYARQRPFEIEMGAATIDKQQLLARQSSPRMILVGGSNLIFGIDSAQIERRTGYHPVNMGLNIGDGLAFMLKNVQPWLRRDDVIIVSPEYEHFGDFYYGKGDFLYEEVEHSVPMIKSFTVPNYLEVVKKGYIIPGEILRYTVQEKGAITRQYLASKDSVYRRDGFNEYGDLVAHYGSEIRLQKNSIVSVPSTSHIDEETIKRAIDGLNDFNDVCRARGVRVYYSFPPIPRDFVERDAPVINGIATALRHKLDFPILESPEDMIFPLNDFFDGYYHLTQAGGAQRTDRLVNGFLSVTAAKDTGR